VRAVGQDEKYVHFSAQIDAGPGRANPDLAARYTRRVIQITDGRVTASSPIGAQ
jgi:hypothetical protein